MIFFALFPILTVLFSFVFFHREPEKDFRETILKVSVGACLLLVAITELFSFFSLISFPAIYFFWIITTLFSGKLVYQNRSKIIFPNSLRNMKPWETGLLVLVLFVLFFIGLLAFDCPPNNFDAMTYRLSRVEHWIQNNTLAHYPTRNIRQLYSNPLTEMITLHFRILTDSDYFSNAIQWFSMIGILLGTALIAAKLKINKQGQWLSVIFCLTIPMVLLQGSASQNDLVVAFFMICFTSGMLSWIENDQREDCVFMGFSLGLAILAKGTAYMFGLPFFILILVWGFSRHRQAFLPTLFLIAVVTALPITGHYSRNFVFCGVPMGHQEGLRKEFKLHNTLSNILKVIAANLATPLPSLNNHIKEGVIYLHRISGLNFSSTEAHYEGRPFSVDSMPFHEECAGQPLHMTAIFLSLIFIFARRIPIWEKTSKTDEQVISQESILKLYGLSLLAGGIIYCTLTLWQPWLTRLTMPLLVLAAPLVGFAFSFLHRYILVAIVVVAFIQALPVIFLNSRKPILNRNMVKTAFPFLLRHSFQQNSIFELSRMENLFNFTSLLPACRKVQRQVQTGGHTQIGLLTKDDFPEYYFWVLFQELGMPFRMEQILRATPDMPTIFPAGVFLPTFIISEIDLGDSIKFGISVYPRNPGDFKPMFIYEIPVQPVSTP